MTKYYVNGQPVSREEFSSGNASRLAEMLESGQGPSLRTDSDVIKSHCNGSQFEKTPWLGDALLKVAKQAGISTKGKVYKHGLAKHFGDPEAWISDGGDVRRVCEARGWGSEGSVTVKAREAEDEHKPIPIAKDIVDREVCKVLRNTDKRKKVNVNELREQVADKLTTR